MSKSQVIVICVVVVHVDACIVVVAGTTSFAHAHAWVQSYVSANIQLSS